MDTVSPMQDARTRKTFTILLRALASVGQRATADALGVSLDWLAGRDRKHQPELTPEQEELVEAYNRLDEAHRSVVLNMVRDLAGK